ncbi:MAG: hypothetical protein AB7F79_08275 [Steroidobacteraceae bacterium]
MQMLLATVQAAVPTCIKRPEAAHALRQLQQVMATGRFVAYQPTSLQVINGELTQADPASIERDLRVLRPRFDGLITYGSANGADRVADIAAQLGYRAMIAGVWDVSNAKEISAAIAATQRHPHLVIAISLGNERVFAKQFSPQQLAQAIDTLRKQAPQLVLTTTEPFHIFLEPASASLMSASDFMLVNIHPIFESWFRTAPDIAAATFVTDVVDKLHAVACGPILVKETGVPTAPSSMGFTPTRQTGFYRALTQQFPSELQKAFAYFSAFDAPWRVNDASPVAGVHPEEAHWGLYDERRNPKPVLHEIVLLPK